MSNEISQETLASKLSEYLDIAAGIVADYAPQAVDAALLVVRVDAIFHLLLGFVCIVMAVFTVKHALILWHRSETSEEQKEDVPKFVCCFGILVVAPTVACANLLSLYYWLAAYDPALGMVYKAAQSSGLL